MTPHLLPSGRRAGAVALCATTALVVALAPANARATEIDVNTDHRTQHNKNARTLRGILRRNA